MAWRPIETAPKDGTSILLAEAGSPHVVQAQWVDWDNFEPHWRACRPGAKGYDDIGSMRPTHWSHLPAAPKKTKGLAMSEQKMPALPERDFDGPDGVAGYYAPSVREAIREAVEFGRQQERERLEPLRAAVEAYTNASLRDSATYAALVIHEARTLLEPTR